MLHSNAAKSELANLATDKNASDSETQVAKYCITLQILKMMNFSI